MNALPVSLLSIVLLIAASGAAGAAASISGSAWQDANRNGIREAGELPLKGARLSLFSSPDAIVGNADDVLVTELVTPADGSYLFETLDPGNYFLSLELPSNWELSPADQGGDDAADSDFAGASPVTSMIPLAVDETVVSLDAGMRWLGREGFESGTMGWTIDNDVWELVSTGGEIATTVPGGDYPPDADSRLISPAFVVAGVAENPHLWFVSQIDSHPGDFGQVLIRPFGGSWQVLSALDHFGLAQPLNLTDLNLQSHAGQTVQLGFLFHSDADANTAAGWTLENLAVMAPGSVNAWDGGGDGTSWHDPLNWSSDTLPGSDDHVWIDVTSNPTVQFNVNAGDVAIKSLFTRESIVFSGGSLTVAESTETLRAMTVNAGGVMTTDELVVRSGGSVTLQSGGILGAGPVEVEGTLWMNTSASFASLRVGLGGLVSHASGDEDFELSVSGDVIVEAGGRIDVSGRGHGSSSGPGQGPDHSTTGSNSGGGGAGHGGSGGSGYVSGGGSYGLLLEPVEMGSGGGSGKAYRTSTAGGGAGGGRIRLSVGGTLSLAGEIRAEGSGGATKAGSGDYASGGGGSGGSIWIDAGTLTGAGTISVDGGNGGYTDRGGGGGGGRIAMYYDESSGWVGSLQARGGDGAQDGGAGTIFTKDDEQGFGELAVDNRGRSGAKTILPDGTLTLDGLHVRNQANVDLASTMDLVLSIDTFALDDDVQVNVYTSVSYAGDAGGKFALLRVSGDGLLVLGEGAGLDAGSIELSGGGQLRANANAGLATDVLNIPAGGVFILNNDSIFDGSLVPVDVEGTLWMNTSASFASLRVGLGGLVSHASGDEDFELSVSGDVIVEAGGRIDVSGRGHGSSSGPGQGPDHSTTGSNSGGGGAGHGGSGGSGYVSGGGSYGLLLEPVEMGSGGGSGKAYRTSTAGGGAGGGRIRLSVGGTLSLAGEIRAEGSGGATKAGSGDYASGGGGSGGSIWIDAGTLTGAGTISVDGGNGGYTDRGGGGGGGRIAMYYDESSGWVGSLQARGGDGAQDGGAGTIFTKDDEQGFGELAVDNRGRSGAKTILPDGTLTLDGLHVRNQANVDLASTMDLVLSIDTFALDDDVQVNVYTSVSYAGDAGGKFALLRVSGDGLLVLGEGAGLDAGSIELSGGGQLRANANAGLATDVLNIPAGGVFILNNDSIFDGSLVPVDVEGTLWMNTSASFASLRVGLGGLVSHASGDEDFELSVSGDVIVEAGGRIDVSGRGHGSSSGPGQGPDHSTTGSNSGGGGAGHGGSGGSGYVSGGGSYGLLLEPVEMGSGGGSGKAYRTSTAGGGAGGGRIRLSVGGTLSLAGEIRAEGSGGATKAGSGDYASGGGGSGGSIWIDAGTLTGAGTISVDGGNGGYTDRGGGGGGGRIAMYYDESSGWVGSLQARGGDGAQDGGAGTIFTKDDEQGFGELAVDNRGRSGAKTILPDGTLTLDGLHVRNQANVDLASTMDLVLSIDTFALDDDVQVNVYTSVSYAGDAGGKFALLRVSGDGLLVLGEGAGLDAGSIELSGGGQLRANANAGLATDVLNIPAGGVFILNNDSIFDGSLVPVDVEGTLWMNTSASFASLRVGLGGLVSHASGDEDFELSVSGDVIVEAGGRIDVSGRGHGSSSGPGQGPDHSTTGSNSGGGGAGHGGSGGSGYVSGGGSYGLLLEPVEMGSGGGSGKAYRTSTAGGGAGGGRIRLSVGGTLSLAGEIRAEGSGGATKAGSGDYASGGGGSGGSIWIDAGTLTGAGTISVDGGNGGYTDRGGGGGGGRIAMYYDESSGWVGSLQARGGDGAQDGGAGTIFTKDDEQGFGELAVDNRGRSGAKTILPDGTLTLDGLHVRNQANVDLASTMDLVLSIDTFALDDDVQVNVYTSVSYAGDAGGKFALLRVSGDGLLVLGEGAGLDAGSIELSGGGQLRANANAGLATDVLNIPAGGVFILNNDSIFDGSLVPVDVEGTLWMNTSASFASLRVGLGGLVSHASGDEDFELSVSGDVIVEAGGRIDVSGRGHGSSSGPGQGPDHSTTGSNSGGGGAGHGGSGGSGYVSGGGSYGLLLEPVEMGSGGGSGKAYRTSTAGGGAGGGRIRLSVGGTLSLAGEIRAEGSGGATKAGSGDYASGGGGSGGSIWIDAGTLTGAGTISVDGGNGGYTDRGGGGGGGRIAMYYDESSGWVGSLQARGGDGAQDGGAGTIFTKDDEQGFGELAVDNRGRSGAKTILPDGTLTLDGLHVRNQANVDLASTMDLVLSIDTFALDDDVQVNVYTSVSYAGDAGGKFALLRVSGDGLLVLGEGAGLDAGSIELSGGGQLRANANAGLATDVLNIPAGGVFILNNDSIFDGSLVPVDVEGTLWMNTSASFASLRVGLGGLVSHASGDEDFELSVSGDVIVEAGGRIDVSGRGHGSSSGPGQGPDHSTTGSNSGGGGAGHGGSGGSGYVSGGGSYGLLLEPVEMGSGGGSGKAYRTSTAGGGAGGGRIRLSVGGTLSLAGEIRAEGSGGATKAGSGDYASGGGGSGGSIWIDAGTLTGAGTISVDGGNGGYTDRGGGGGGGRIAMYYDESSGWVGSLQARGGDGAQDGGAGTIFTKDDEQGFGELAVDNRGRSGAKTILPDGTLTLDGLHVRNQANVDLASTMDLVLSIDTFALDDDVQVNVYTSVSYAGDAGGKFALLRVSGDGLLVLGEGAGLDAGSIELSGGGQLRANANAGLATDVLNIPAGGVFILNNDSIFDGSLVPVDVEGTLWMNTSASFASLRVGLGGLVSHASGDEDFELSVSGDVIVEAGGRIDVSGRGHGSSSGPGQGPDHSTTGSNSGGGGAGHGGSGGSGYVSGGGSYGLLLEPVEMGSGGGSGKAYRTSTAGGGAGGGRIRLSVGGTLSLAGEIRAEGSGGATKAGSGDYASGGGGSGGSIWIDAGTLTGAGTISVDGGNGGYTDRGGGGGGGRIAMYYDESSGWVGSLQARGGDGAQDGGAGTIEFSEKKEDYDNWRELHFGSDFLDPAQRFLLWDDDADPDQDGNPNIMEFIMGRNPLVFDSHLGPRLRVEDGEVTLSYPQTTATNHDVIAYVSWSNDLQHWTTGGVLYNMAEDRGDTMMIEANLVVHREDKVFMRLQALRAGGGDPMTGYQQWIVDHGVPWTESGLRHDPNRDGIVNGVAYALGIAPVGAATAEERGRLPSPIIDVGTGHAGVELLLPEIQPADVVYVIEEGGESGDLATWTQIGRKEGAGAWTGTASVTEEAPVDGVVRVRAVTGSPVSSEVQLYWRLRVELNTVPMP